MAFPACRLTIDYRFGLTNSETREKYAFNTYDPAFATLGRLYGTGGRSAITTLTLFGGFASTVCWPLSAFLVTHLGWRGACLTYAVSQLGLSLPVYLLALQRETVRAPAGVAAVPEAASLPVAAISRGLLPLLAAAITLASFVSALLSVHLLTVLQGKGLALSAQGDRFGLTGLGDVAGLGADLVAM